MAGCMERLAGVGIFFQARRDGLPVSVAIFEHGLAGEYVLVWVGNTLFAGGGCAADGLTGPPVPVWVGRISFDSHLLHFGF